MTKTKFFGAALSAVFIAMAAAPASAETLFKIITVKDDITVGLNAAELKDLGGDAVEQKRLQRHEQPEVAKRDEGAPWRQALAERLSDPADIVLN